jgi:hypothetical protein
MYNQHFLKAASSYLKVNSTLQPSHHYFHIANQLDPIRTLQTKTYHYIWELISDFYWFFSLKAYLFLDLVTSIYATFLTFFKN